MNITEISKIIRDFPIKKLPNCNKYAARPYIDGKRYYFSGNSKNEVRDKIAKRMCELYGIDSNSSDSTNNEHWEDVVHQFQKKKRINKPNPNYRPYSKKIEEERNQFQLESGEDSTSLEVIGSDEMLLRETSSKEILSGSMTISFKDNAIAAEIIDPFRELDPVQLDPIVPVLYQNTGVNVFKKDMIEGIVDQYVADRYQDCDPRRARLPYQRLNTPKKMYQNRSDVIQDVFCITTSTGAEVLRELSSISLNAYIEHWLLNYKKMTIEPTTYERMVIVYENHIRESIGLKPLTQVTEEDIQMLINVKANPFDGSRPLAMSGLKKLKELLKPCLDRAVYDGLIPHNPCKGVILPKERYLARKKKKQFSMSDEQIEKFAKACKTKSSTSGDFRSRDGLVLLFILNLGLRVGEAVALEWNDVDFGRRLIYVNKTIQYTREYGELVKDGAKTESGNRVLPINDTVYELLNEMRLYDSRHNISSDYICCSLTGRRKDCRNLQRSLERILKLTDIQDHITLHTLRHTFGSTLLRRGVNIEVISQLMGHSSITITYNKYIHVLQEQKALAMNMVSVT